MPVKDLIRFKFFLYIAEISPSLPFTVVFFLGDIHEYTISNALKQTEGKRRSHCP